VLRTVFEVCRGVGAGGVFARVAVVEDGNGGVVCVLVVVDRMGAESAGISDTRLASRGLLLPPFDAGTAAAAAAASAVEEDPAGRVLTSVLSSFFPSLPRTSLVVVVVVVVVVTVETTSPVSSSSTSPVLLFTAKLRSLCTPPIWPSFGTETRLLEYSDRGLEGASLLAYAESCTGPLRGDTAVGMLLALLVVVLASSGTSRLAAVVLPCAGANRSDEVSVVCGFEVLSFFQPKIPLRRLLSFLACMVSVSLPSVRALLVKAWESNN
jgi:hypothetical protein